MSHHTHKKKHEWIDEIKIYHNFYVHSTYWLTRKIEKNLSQHHGPWPPHSLIWQETAKPCRKSSFEVDWVCQGWLAVVVHPLPNAFEYVCHCSSKLRTFNEIPVRYFLWILFFRYLWIIPCTWFVGQPSATSAHIAMSKFEVVSRAENSSFQDCQLWLFLDWNPIWRFEKVTFARGQLHFPVHDCPHGLCFCSVPDACSSSVVTETNLWFH